MAVCLTGGKDTLKLTHDGSRMEAFFLYSSVGLDRSAEPGRWLGIFL